MPPVPAHRRLALAVAILSLVWVAVLAAAPYVATHAAAESGLFRASALTYVAGSFLCHQRADRSFHAWGTQWPVCARCTGLYAGAPAGALLVFLRWRRRDGRGTFLRVLLLAAIPTLLTLVGEWLGVGVPGWMRAIAGVPLGAAVAFAVTGVN